MTQPNTRLAAALALLLVGCDATTGRAGELGGTCLPDGSCSGSLVCVERWAEVTGHYYRCVPKEVAGK